MAGKKDENWQNGYRALYLYVETHHHLPNKNIMDGRWMLNWWKYNKKCMKRGTLTEEQIRMLEKLKGMCSAGYAAPKDMI